MVISGGSGAVGAVARIERSEMDALAIWHAAPGFRPRSTRATAPRPGRGPSDRRRELSEQRVVATEHIIDLRHDDRIGAVLTQKAREVMNCVRRAVQGQHARRRRPPERRQHAEHFLGETEQSVVAARKLRPHFAKQPRSRVRGDAIEDEAARGRGRARPARTATPGPPRPPQPRAAGQAPAPHPPPLAYPQPSPPTSPTFPSASGIIPPPSSPPVMPKCTAPAASCSVI